MQGAQANLRSVRNLAYLALLENDQIFNLKAGYVRCATCVITRGVSSIRVFRWALGRASSKTWILKGTPLFFSAPRVPTCKGDGAEKERIIDNNEKTTIHGITVAVGYGWQKFDESEILSQDKTSNGYDVLYDAFWKSIRDKFLPKCGGVGNSLNAKISFKRLRASHGKLVWNSILKNINNADVLVFDVAAAPDAKAMSKDWSNIKDVIKSFNYNVLVEIGVALGLDKRVVLMCPDHLFDKVPSDLKGYLWTTYRGEISKDGFKRCFCDERGIQNAFMGMLREAIKEKNKEVEIEE